MPVTEEERDTSGLVSQLPMRNITIIFIVTFFLVFVIFTMVEPSIICGNSLNGLGDGCRLQSITGDFMLGILASGLLFLFDMLFLYMTLSEYFM